MLQNWFHSVHFGLSGSLLVFAAMALSVAGLVLFKRLSPTSVLEIDNDVVSGTMSIVGIAYAILTALIVAATWQNVSDAGGIAEVEAGTIANLYRNASGLPAELAPRLRMAVTGYVNAVIDTEWPAQRHGDISQAGRAEIYRIHELILSFVPETPRETVVQAELLREVNDLFNARAKRLLAAGNAVLPEIWGIIIAGALLTVACTYFFKIENFTKHIAITSVVSASMALVIVLVLALDRPFRGDLSVGTESYQHAIEDAQITAASHR